MSMRKQNMMAQTTRPMMRSLMALTALVCLASARPVHATYQIGQFSNDGASGITWTNTGNTSGSLTGTESGYFTFTNLGSLLSDPSLSGVPQAATMTITANTVTDGFTANGQVNQPLSGSVTIQILGTSGQDYLTATVTSGTTLLSGPVQGSSGAVIAATPRDNVTYQSDFFNTSALNNQAFSIGLSAIDPALSFNTTGGHSILNDFTAVPVATFSANAVSVPEPASLALLGIGCVVLAGARRRVRWVRG